MFTDPQHRSGEQAVAEAVPAGAHRPFSWAWKRVQQAMCSLHGHDSLLQFEHNRMFLRCTSCGFETPGWEISPQEAARLRHEQAAHAKVLRPAPELFATRKIA